MSSSSTAAAAPSSSAPMTWSLKDKSPLLEVALGTRVKYVGSTDPERESASVRTTCPISPRNGIFYFEIKILTKGDHGSISIGLSSKQVSMSRLPGCEKTSFGYHGDDGKIFSSASTGTEYGPLFEESDVIGCCLDFSTMTIFFTKNGENLGPAFEDISVEMDSPLHELYASVGMRCPGEEVHANFGTEPFVFDIDEYVRESKARNMQRVLSSAESPVDEAVLNKMVLSYLVHRGYLETAKQLAGDTAEIIPESAHSIQYRRDIQRHIQAGQVDQARELIQRYYGDLLQTRPAVDFRLKCHKFIHMVQAKAADEEVLQYGAQLQQLSQKPPYNTEENTELLQSSFGLLAYSNPESSPLSHLLSKAAREELADSVNSAILENLGFASKPLLERTVAQIQACLEALRQRNDGTAAMLDVRDVFPTE